MPERQALGFCTELVHAGERLAPPAGRPTATPIYTTSTFVHPSARALDEAFVGGVEPVYARNLNPTVSQVEVAMQTIECGAGAVMFASGMAALHTALLSAATADGEFRPRFRGIVCGRELYGATTTLVEQFLAAFGCPIVSVDPCDLVEVERVLRELRPNVLFAEQLSNPLLRVIDVTALANLAHACEAKLVVDGTFATPLLEQPLREGADFVVHSATKYLGGHGDVTGGVVVARTRPAADTLRRYLKLLGSILGPFEASLVGRGIKTLGLRMDRQCENAALVADFLQHHRHVARVHYPGLASHPQHELARQCFRGRFGAMVSFEIASAAPDATERDATERDATERDATERDATRSAVCRVMDAFELIWPATSLGDVYTLVTAPFISSHRDLTAEERRIRHIPDSLLRLSVGIEDVNDIRQDLERALSTLD